MAGATPERQRPEQKEQFRPFMTPGVARFMVTAQLDLSAKHYFNPEPVKFAQPVDALEIRDALGKAQGQYVDMHLVDVLSTGLRYHVTEQQEQAGKTKEQQMTEWATGMVSFFQDLATTASPELKELSRKRLGIDISQTDESVLWEQTSILWDKYLAKGSNIERFFADVLTGVHGTSPGAIAEMQRRIGLVDPLLGIFGDDRIALLARDAENAVVLLEVSEQYKKRVADEAVAALQQDFSTPSQKDAYQLLWNNIKDEVSEERGHASTPPMQPTASQPPQPARNESAPAHAVSQQQPAVQQKAPETVGEPRPAAKPQPTLSQRREETVASPPAEDQKAIPEPEHAPTAPALRQETQAQEYVRSAAVVTRDPERPWVSDTLLLRELAGGGFVMGAFTPIEKGGAYSAAVARKAKQAVNRIVRVNGQTSSVDVTIREALAALGQVQPFLDLVKSAAVQELGTLKADDAQKKDVVESIGTSGLLAVTAKDQGKDFLVTLNLGNARLISYNPLTGELKTVIAEQLVPPDRFLPRPQRLFRTEDQKFVDAHTDVLSHSVQQDDVNELGKKYQHQKKNGWSQQDEMLRVMPVEKGNLYLLLTNGITLNIPPAQLSEVIQRAYMQSQKPQNHVDMTGLVRIIAQEARTRMRKPEDYPLEVRGKTREYVVRDSLGAAGIWYA